MKIYYCSESDCVLLAIFLLADYCYIDQIFMSNKKILGIFLNRHFYINRMNFVGLSIFI